jgi:hypothetical protein
VYFPPDSWVILAQLVENLATLDCAIEENRQHSSPQAAKNAAATIVLNLAERGDYGEKKRAEKRWLCGQGWLDFQLFFFLQ